jgi:hypothetical protein
MAKYYSLALYKIKEVKVAQETVQVIEKLVTEKESTELSIIYHFYKMKDLWKKGLFS